MEENLTIREMAISDINAIASIHSEELSESFLGRMGCRFLRRLYDYMFKEESFKCFVAEGSSEICGFVAIALDSAQFYKKIYKKHLFSLACEVMLIGIRQPDIILSSFQLFFSKSMKPPDIKTELLSICVKKGYQGKGLGRRLVNTSLTSLKTKGIDSISVIVHPNIPANNFYKSLGFTYNRQIVLYGENFNLYLLKLS